MKKGNDICVHTHISKTRTMVQEVKALPTKLNSLTLTCMLEGEN